MTGVQGISPRLSGLPYDALALLVYIGRGAALSRHNLLFRARDTVGSIAAAQSHLCFLTSEGHHLFVNSK